MRKAILVPLAIVILAISFGVLVLAWANGFTGQAIAYLGVVAAVCLGAWLSLRGSE